MTWVISIFQSSCCYIPGTYWRPKCCWCCRYFFLKIPWLTWNLQQNAENEWTWWTDSSLRCCFPQVQRTEKPQEHALPCLCCWGFVLVHLWSSFSPLFSWRCHKRPTHILLLGRMCSVDGTFFGYSWRVAAFYNIQINIHVHLETHDAFRIVSNPNPHAATSGRLCWSEKACALTFTVKGFHEEMDCEQHILHHTPTICNIGFFLGGDCDAMHHQIFFNNCFYSTPYV